MRSSAADDNVLEAPGAEAALLDHYHEELMARLQERGCTGSGDAAASGSGRAGEGGPAHGVGYTRQVLQAHVDWALLDFVRFMVGWGMWGAAGWSERKARELLARGIA